MGVGCIGRRHRDLYLDLAGQSRVDEAVELCLDLLDRGAAPEDIALGLLRPAQHDVGRRWALGTWSVAQEHAASAVADAALATLGAAVPARTHGDPLMVACPHAEWHGLAARMVTQVLRWRGVAAEYVGPLASDASLEELLRDGRPRALALSCTMTSALPGVARAVDIAGRHGTAVLGGGVGFGPRGRYAPTVGVTAWDDDVIGLMGRLSLWDTTGWPDRRHPAPEPVAYRRLVRRRRAVADEIADRLLDDRVDVTAAEMLRDAAEQVADVALAAARTGHAAILADGLRELVAVLTERPEPVAAVAARLPEAAHTVVDHYRGAA